MARLIVIKGADEGKQYELPPEAAVTLGRDRTNRVVVHDTEASRRHAELSPVEGGHYRLRDLDSANGTLVNGRPVADAVLKAGDHITLGQTVLVYAPDKSAGPRPGRPDPRRRPQGQGLVHQHPQERRRGRGQPHPVPARGGGHAVAQVPPRQPGRHVRDDPGRQPHSRPRPTPRTDRGTRLRLDPGRPRLRHAPEPGHRRRPSRRPSASGTAVNRDGKVTVSRTVMDYVLREKQGVLVSDAAEGRAVRSRPEHHPVRHPRGHLRPHEGPARDPRRPLPRHHRPGAGSRPGRPGRRAGRFTEDHLTLAIAIAHQAALAVEETRYHHALRPGRAAGGRRPDHRGTVAPHQEHHAGGACSAATWCGRPSPSRTTACSPRAGRWSSGTRARSTNSSSTCSASRRSASRPSRWPT